MQRSEPIAIPGDHAIKITVSTPTESSETFLREGDHFEVDVTHSTVQVALSKTPSAQDDTGEEITSCLTRSLDPSEEIKVISIVEDQPHPLGEDNFQESELYKKRLDARTKKNKSYKANDVESGLSDEEGENLLETHQQMTEKPRSSWFGWVGKGIVNAVKSVGETALFVIKHPIITTLSIVTASPAALNALMNPSGKSPKEINLEWWDKMSPLVRTHSLINMTSSLAINAIMNAFFLPTAWQKFSSSIKYTFRSPADFFDNLLSIFLGVGGAIAAGAIGYEAFLWLPYGEFTSFGPALIAFTVTLASRYLGVKNVFKRIRNFFSPDAQAQAVFADAIDHIDKKHLNAIELEFDKILVKLFENRNSDVPLSHEELEKISKKLAKIMKDFAIRHPDFIKAKTSSEYIIKYAGMLFDFTFALCAIGTPAYLVYMQKGFDGVNTIAQFAGSSFSDWKNSLKRAVGMAPGLATGMLYFDYATKIRGTLIELIKYLYENPQFIPAMLTVMAGNGFSASGPQNVAANVVAKSDNITGLEKGSILGTAVVILNALGGGAAVNGVSSMRKAASLDVNKNPVELNLTDLAHYLHKVDDHLVATETAQKFTLFSMQLQARTSPSTVEERQTAAVFSSI